MHTPCFVSCIQKSNKCPLCRQKMFNIVPTSSTELGHGLQHVFSSRESRGLLRNSPPLRAPRRVSRSPVRSHRRRRDIVDYYNDDYDIDVEDMLDNSNVYRSSGRVAGFIIFIMVDLIILCVWAILIWYKN